MSRAWPLLVLLASGCLTAWDVGGPWRCNDDRSCPNGLTCDDGVCCVPGGSPVCPTLPADNGCPLGSSPAVFYADRDGDGFGDRSTGRGFCRQPVLERWVEDGTDCDDTDVGINPNAGERCNAVDDDCDGVIDNGLRTITWFRDPDGDGFGSDDGGVLAACDQPRGFVERGGDCNPNDARVHPGAIEQCNDIDENCNGQPADGPFEQVSPLVDGGVEACTSGRPGLCSAGTVQCLFSPVTGSWSPGCVPMNTPRRDVCSQNEDNDCNGNRAGRPGCGGPLNLLTEPGVTMGALAFPLPASLPTSCQQGAVGGVGMGWLNPVWIASSTATDGRLQVWWARAPANFGWDLTTASTVNFPFRVAPINQAPEGTFVTDLATGFPNPVVLLCGPGGALRYVPSAAARLTNASELRVSVPLRGDAAWVVTGDPAAVLSNVTQVELWVSPRTHDAGVVTFSNRFLDTADAGAPGFR